MSDPQPDRPTPVRRVTRPKGAARQAVHRRLLLLNLSAALLGLAAWAFFSYLKLAGLPGPLAVLERAGQLISNGSLLNDTLASVRRVLIGFALGTLLAIPVGFLMGWYTVARGLMEPYVQFFRTIPPWP